MKSKDCSYYSTYRHRSSSRQNNLLVESYCEGQLQSMCRRQKHEKEFSKAAPNEMAPNGYLVGTHSKIRVENIRRHKRYNVSNGPCMLQVFDTKKTFGAWIVDISEGGIRLELDTHPKDLDICSEKTFLKILGYSADAIPLPLTKEVVKPIWLNNQTMGCSFVSSVA